MAGIRPPTPIGLGVVGTAPLTSEIREAEATLASLRRLAAEQSFEEGFENEFSRSLAELVEGHAGVPALNILVGQLASGLLPAEVVSETARVLGRIEHPPTRAARMAVIESCLASPLAPVRDGAVVGLSHLDDPAAIPLLRRAIERESCGGLRADMQQVLDQLEATARCRSS